MSLRGLSIILLLLSLASASFSDCTLALLQLFSKTFTLVPTDTPSAMAALSGKWLNDLGDYKGCSRIPEAEYALIYLDGQRFFVGVGLCGPKICKEEDYYLFFEQPWSNTTLFADYHTSTETFGPLVTPKRLSQTPQVKVIFPRMLEPAGVSTGAGWMLFLSGVIFCCVVAGTMLELIHVPEPPRPQVLKDSIELVTMTDLSSKSTQFLSDSGEQRSSQPSMTIRCLSCFSLTSNLPRLFSTGEKERQDPLFALNGVRVVSMMWIILGHVLIFGISWTPIKNPQDVVPFVKTYETAMISSAQFAVDTFMWLTGLLLTFILLQKLNSSDRSPTVIQAYIHRVVRILPTYAFALLLTWTISPYAVNGPLSYKMDIISNECADHWWKNLLFVNNEYQGGAVCLPQAWYLAVDMQLYVVCVPIVMLYHRNRLFGWVGVAALCIVSSIASGGVFWANDFRITPTAPRNAENDYMFRYYFQPYCRAAPMALGLLTAFVLHSARVYKSTTHVYDSLAMGVVSLYESTMFRWVSSLVGAGICCFLVLMEHSAMQGIDDESLVWTLPESTMFVMVSRLLWGMSLSLIMLPILLGRAPACRWLLSWSIWAPLARLSFGAYLLHIHIGCMYRSSIETASWFGDLSLYTDFCFMTLLSYGASIPLSLGVEIPAQGLARLLLKAA